MAKSDSTKTVKSKKGKKTKGNLLKNIEGQLKTSKKDLIEQVKTLSKDLAKFKEKNSSKKIIKKIEKKYKQESEVLKREFNETLSKLHELQEKMMDSLPSASELTQKLKINQASKETTAEPKAPPAKKASTPKAKSELAAIKGIGPVTQKKLEQAGITSLEDLANTPSNKQEALKSFEKVKGFETWAQQAKELLAGK